MLLTKNEFSGALQNEVRILLHLASKIEPAMLDFRPTPKQRSLLELLQYFTIVGPIHLGAALNSTFDMDAWRTAWRTNEATAKTLDLDRVKTAIAQLPAQFAAMLDTCSDTDLRAEIEMFGHRASRGSWMVNLVLSHYTAYRMQLFLYLKSCGRDELNTMNLWAGMDAR
jgi:hypothetical protein